MTWWSKGRVDGSYDTALCVSFREVFRSPVSVYNSLQCVTPLRHLHVVQIRESTSHAC